MAYMAETSMKYGGPLYIAVGFGLILMVAYAYLYIVFPALNPDLFCRALHFGLGAVLFCNILFNYWMCIVTKPGTTALLNEGYHLAAGRDSCRFCKHCRRAKPPRAHHCSICNTCVLQMDHHCPWMNNCIGFFNYRYFILFMLYLFMGSGYAATTAWNCLADANSVMHSFPMLIFSFAISTSACFSVGVLLCWHVYLVLTAQSTIDFLKKWGAARELKQQGKTWCNPYNLGPVANWQEVFDVHGRFWWILWLVPNRRMKKGTGVASPVKLGSQDIGLQHDEQTRNARELSMHQML
ncbi:Palmitoyltransferase ZDHHC16 [Coccomyxa sp. Obi]|nr:Palmitoyltransferase ZDHHC16 [Coccomyxa sp. Obi]